MIHPQRTRLLFFLLVLAIVVAVSVIGGGWAWDGPDGVPFPD
jgi:hypothetical protein